MIFIAVWYKGKGRSKIFRGFVEFEVVGG